MDTEKSTRDYIDEEVIYQTCQLRQMKPGTEEYARVAETIERLQKLNLKDSEIDTTWDTKDKEISIKEKELELMRDELEETKRNNKRELIKGLALGFGGTALSMACLTGLSLLGFKFEEEGSISSNTMRQIQGATSSLIRKNI